MKLNNGLLFLIVLLLVANLCGTFWLIKKTSSTESNPAPQSDAIDKEILLREFDRSTSIYNSGDQESLWNMFSEYARAQMNKENSIKSIMGLKDLFGNIKDGTYMYQEYAGKKGNLSFFKGYFTVNLLNSKIGGKALLILTISSDGSTNELVGFHLNTT